MGIEDRANTPEQKKEIMKRLMALWEKNPSMRFTQLLENVFHHSKPDHCFYYVEDYPFIESLEEFYGEIDEKQKQ